MDETALAWRALFLVAFGLAGMVAVLARVRTIRYSLWHDETYTLWYFVREGPGEIVASPAYDPVNHIFSNLLVWLVATPLGYAEWVVRSPSTLAGLAALALLVWFAHRRGGRATALVVLVLSAVSVEQAELIPQVRGYGIAYLTAVGLLVLSWALTEHFSTPLLAAYCATMFVAVYNYPSSALMAVATTLLLVPLVRRRLQLLGAAAATAVLVVLAYLPLLRALYQRYETGFGGDIERLPWHAAFTAPFEKVSGLYIDGFSVAPDTVLRSIATIVVLVAGVAILARRDRALALLLAGAPSLALLLGTLARAPMGAPRYTSFIGPHALLLAAIGVVAVWRRLVPEGLGEAATRRSLPELVGALLVVALVVAVTVPNLQQVGENAALPYENFKQAMREVEIVAEREDVALIANSTRPVGFIFYAERTVPDLELQVGDGPEETCQLLRAVEPGRTIMLLDHSFRNEQVITEPQLDGIGTVRPEQRGRGEIFVHRVPAGAVVEPGQDGICGDV